METPQPTEKPHRLRNNVWNEPSSSSSAAIRTTYQYPESWNFDKQWVELQKHPLNFRDVEDGYSEQRKGAEKVSWAVYDAKGFMEEVDIADHFLMTKVATRLTCHLGPYLINNHSHNHFVIDNLWYERQKMMMQRFSDQADTFGSFESPDAPNIDEFMAELDLLDPTVDKDYDRLVELLQKSNLPQYGWPLGENVDSDSSDYRTVKGYKVLEYVDGRAQGGKRKSIARTRLTEKEIYVWNYNRRWPEEDW